MSADAQRAVDPALVDLGRLGAWMDEQGLPAGPIEQAAVLAGGTQNILLRFTRGGRSFVLRRPPPHLRKNSNETMRREARVLAALAGSDVPHPGFIAGCPETDVLGAAFYLMEPIEGFNASTGVPASHGTPAMRHAMGLALADGIAALGRVDYLAVGLSDYGKPDGFLERQVERWRSQLESYSALPGYPGPQIPGVERVATWLEAHRPPAFQPGILHGDFHIANVMYRHDSPALAAIVDWELSTIGDPLLDLGWLLATWPVEDGSAPGGMGGHAVHGFPRADEIVARYRAQTTRDLSHVDWYAVLACYKLGIILEGTHARAFAGQAPKETGDLLHATTVALFERALGWVR